jgi:hypothetical protein
MERFRGRTITFKFEDGAMANKSYAHTFSDEGDIAYKAAGSDGEGTRARASRIEKLREDVWIVAYLGEGGYTLTTVLDFASNRLVSIASNEKEVSVHHGTFETARDVMDESDQLEQRGATQSPTPIH